MHFTAVRMHSSSKYNASMRKGGIVEHITPVVLLFCTTEEGPNGAKMYCDVKTVCHVNYTPRIHPSPFMLYQT